MKQFTRTSMLGVCVLGVINDLREDTLGSTLQSTTPTT